MKKFSMVVLLFLVLIWSGCSESGSTTIKIYPLAPANDQVLTDSQVEFRWKIYPLMNGVKFNLYIGKSYTSLREFAKGITATSYRVALERGVYYFWKVEAVYEGESYYSHTYSFMITDGGNYILPSPLLMSPAVDSNFKVGVKVYLQWSGVTSPVGGVYYRVFLGDSPKTLKIYADRLTGTSIGIENLNIGTYFWKVEAVDDSGKVGSSSVWRFLISEEGNLNMPPTPPELLWPGVNEVLEPGNIVFEWGASEDPEGGDVSYTLFIAGRDGVFREVESGIRDTSLTYSINTEGLYYWKVVAYDNAGNMTSSLVGKFFVGGTVGDYLRFKQLMMSKGPTICGLTTEGQIYCWGNVNGAGRGVVLNDIRDKLYQEPAQPLFPTGLTFEKMGDRVPVALTTDGELWEWSGGLPRELKNPDGVRWTGIYNYAFLDENNNLWYWGYNLESILASGGFVEDYLSQPVKINKPSTDGEWIGAFYLMIGVVGIFEESNGNKKFYYYGLYSTDGATLSLTDDYLVEVTQVSGSPWVDIFLGDYGIEGLNARGEVWNFGFNIQPKKMEYLPFPVKKFFYFYKNLNPPYDISYCALDMADELICRGANDYGVMMTYSTSLTLPTVIMSKVDFQDLKMSSPLNVACELKDENIYCWGSRKNANLGVYYEERPYVPFKINSYYTDKWKSLTAFGGEFFKNYICGIDEYGYLYCWGESLEQMSLRGYEKFSALPQHGNFAAFRYGIVAIDSTGRNVVGYSKVVSYPSHGRGSRWVAMGVGYLDYNLEPGTWWWFRGRWFMLDDAGDLYWNEFDLPDTTSVLVESYPTRVTWIDFYVGEKHMCAISYQYQVYCMGRNDTGQLGDVVAMGQSVDKLVLVPSLASKRFETVACGKVSTCAITLDGAMYCWGDGSTVAKLVKNPLGRRWKSVYMQNGVIFATDEDDRLWVWGSNNSSAIMTYPENYTPSSPVPSYSVTFRVKEAVTDGKYVGCALDANDGIWCWGRGSDGNIGGYPTTWVPNVVHIRK